MPDNYEEAINHALRQVYREIPIGSDYDTSEMPTLSQLRAAPLGMLLCRIAGIARSEEVVLPSEVWRLVRALLAVIFWSKQPDIDQLQAFYRTEPLGQMLMRAKWASVATPNLMTVETAAMLLGVEVKTIMQWIFTDVIEFVRDDMTDRFFVIRSDVARIHAKQRRVSTLYLDYPHLISSVPTRCWQSPPRELPVSNASQASSGNVPESA